MRGSRKFITIAAGIGVLVLVVACGLLALLPRGELTQQEAEQRAIEAVKEQHGATVTAVSAHRTSPRELGVSCLPDEAAIARWRARILLDWDKNICDAELPLWRVTMEGEFHWVGGNISREASVLLWPDGNWMSINEMRAAAEPQP